MNSSFPANIDIFHSDSFRMAQACIANKNEFRTVLQYLFLDCDAGEVFGTDGNRALAAKCIITHHRGRYLIKPEKKIPRRWVTLSLDLLQMTLSGNDAKGRLIGTMSMEVKTEKVLGVYPNIHMVIPTAERTSDYTSSVCFDYTLLAEVLKAGPTRVCELNFGKIGEPILINFENQSGLQDVVKFCIAQHKFNE